jgi:hypothetical protein
MRTRFPAAAFTLCLATMAPAIASDPVLDSLAPVCGQAHGGTVVSTDDADKGFASSRLVMHLRDCRKEEVRIPFNVGEDRSRTWILSRTDTGYRLKHRHIHEDGTPDKRTNYGGDHIGPPKVLPGGGWRLEFPADPESKAMFEAGATPQSSLNVWAMEHVPGKQFVYELRRPQRFLRVEFDMADRVDTPQPPWGVPVEP